MERQEILNRLRQSEHALRERGITHAALFGSRVRGDHCPDSDIDLLIDVDPEAVQDVYAYVGLKTYIAELFGEPVDAVTREALKPYVRPVAETDAVHAF
jgi:predicted nucleotidyltransferase